MDRSKRRLLRLFSVLLVLCVASGVTLAYLATVTNERENVFTPSENILARLSEPNWDKTEGINTVPGAVIRKDPMITNTGKTDEYAAIRLTFRDRDGGLMPEADLIRLLNLLSISWNDKWRLFDGSMLTDGTGKLTGISQPLIFYYPDRLTPGAVTEPLFHSLRVGDRNDGLTEADLRWLQAVIIPDGHITSDPEGGIGFFCIGAEGSAVQTVGFADAGDAAGALKALFPPP